MVLFRGGCLVPGGSGLGGCLVETPRTATAAGGTHPTGMHSCTNLSYKFLINLFVMNFLNKFFSLNLTS